MERGEGHAGVRWTGRPAWSEYVFLWFFTMVFGVRTGFALWIGEWGMAIINGLGVVLFVTLAVFFRQTTHYTMTHDAVYKTKGLAGKSESRVPIADIASVSIRQSALDRFLGIGTVMLHLKDGARERLVGLKNPGVIQRKLEALLPHAKQT
jgi:membrane protein YdbS with pleckstrin-like domain